MTVVPETAEGEDTGVTNGGHWTRTEGVEKGPLRSKAIELIPESREKLRVLVGDMRINLYILKKEATTFDKEMLLWINTVEKYQKSCWGDKTWMWDAKAWRNASWNLSFCLRQWKKKSKDADEFSWWPGLRDYCQQCVRDMERYKQLCEKGSTRNDDTYTARFRRYWNLECKLEALKTLA